MRLSTGLGTDAAPSPVASKYAQATQTGLTTQFHFTYSTAGYPSTPDGSLSVVALRDELTPDPASKSSYGITAQATTGGGQLAKLTVANSTQVQVHFRYDPNRWDVAGVGSLNPWGTPDGQFLPVCTVLEPGVLLIANQPVGQAVKANGEFAQCKRLIKT
jgi:hypothetical protein